MEAEKLWERRWLRFYKLLACVGLLAVLIPVYEILCVWVANRYSGILSLFLVPLLFLLGYVIQWLLLGRSRRKLRDQQVDFSFESKKLRLPLPRVLLACAVSAGIALLISSAVGARLAELLGILSKPDAGIPIMMAASAVVSVLGCLVVPLRFHQLMSLRTMLEMLTAFVLFFGLKVYWSGSVSALFIICFLLWSLCLILLMNQEYIIRPSYFSSAYYATGQLRKAGMKDAFRLWTMAVVLQLAVLGAVSLFVIPLRAILTRGQNFRLIFDFPFRSLYVLNFLLFLASVIALLVFVFCLSLHVTPAHLRRFSLAMRSFRAKIREKIRNLLRRLVSFVKNKLRKNAGKLLGQRFKREHLAEEPKIRNYVDTVTDATGHAVAERYDTYRAFARKLRSLKTEQEQFCFAYKTLFLKFCDENIGVKMYHTPLEAAQIVCEKTAFDDFAYLTDIYMDVIYANADRSVEKDLERLCEIVKDKFK